MTKHLPNNEPLDWENSLPSCKMSTCSVEPRETAAALNRDCVCKTFDRDKFTAILNADPFNHALLQTHPQLFSNTAVFVSPEQVEAMREIVGAVENIVKLPTYQQNILERSQFHTLFNPGTAGVFMGFDFHLSGEGPKIIEINTNAGGAFLNAALVKAQLACCRAEDSLPLIKENMEAQIIDMFLQEWRYQRHENPLSRIAIVDDTPTHQFLYPEFKMAQRLFEQHGIEAVIAAPEELIHNGRHVFYKGSTIDLVYNRLTDFLLTDPSHHHLLDAYYAGSIVLTPSPRHHALYADKRNLAILTDETILTDFGGARKDIDTLKRGIPNTQLVSADNADQVWRDRKHLFFKPAAGFGSRAAYRGDKLTKRVWEEILRGDYVAQTLIPPSERSVRLDNNEKIALKTDIRAYVYEGEIQLLTARLYQGQTTNFRTQGGGFAPVYVTG